ncbi:phage coat protein [Vibrio pectenicida]|uniref:Phage coat protein n=1 Tax=Vibrio pectenicida TaxID=62763 RepID=A0A7Y4EGF7_9VIBR|nr:phage coat protein [Vibrio pectenicida]NOH73428.1 phage coat protein [Vibrio pectenicida]
MKYVNQAKKFTSTINTKLAVGALTLMATSPAFAEASATDAIWNAVDLSGMAAKVLGAGVLVIGLCMAFKSVKLGKRTVNLA